MDLIDLAKRFHAFENVDKSDFQRKARILQSIWREKQGYDPGEFRGKIRGARLRMPWAKESLANYLTDTIREVVRNEVLDKVKSQGKMYGSPRIFNNLLSSQPLCFNLFGELQQDLDLASRIMKTLTSGRVHEVTGIEFEHSPGRGNSRYTDDNSAFDVYITYRGEKGERGFTGIEVKYHENLKQAPAQHRPRYDEVAEAMNCFLPDQLPRLREKPLEQIWRDHLLAGSILQVDDFDDGFFVFLYPQDNLDCAKAVKDYRGCLYNSESFKTWTLEEVVAALRNHTQAAWIDSFVDRYLDFSKLNG